MKRIENMIVFGVLAILMLLITIETGEIVSKILTALFFIMFIIARFLPEKYQ